MESTFNHLLSALMDSLQAGEVFTLELIGEQSQFTRFNGGKVRQTGSVVDGTLNLSLKADQRGAFREIPFTGELESDRPLLLMALEDLRQELPQLPEDPYLVKPVGEATSHEVHSGQLLNPDAVVAAILPEVTRVDFTGIYAGGVLLRAYADSAGQRHWFSTESFALDYSLFTEDGKAVKGTFAGSEWNPDAYAAKLAESKRLLAQMNQPAKPIQRGEYRTYLAPAAMAELMGMFSWGAVSESSMQRGGSALAAMRRGEKTLSPRFTLRETFSRGLVPRFNGLGEIAPMDLPLIEAGQLVNTLISARTAKEFNLTSNGADGGEYLRSPEVNPGNLPSAEVLTKLETGLYLSNLHYLNWSDRPNGRITGMTRYACFWVEQGEIIAPIENLRFDESLYRCFGENLLALTQEQEFIPEVGTYTNRNLGGIWVPGALIEAFRYTL